MSCPEKLKSEGPLLLASNHPNSFLDAIIIDVLFEQPVHSLTRGDVFINSFVTRILTALKMLPVYRVTEGVENLSNNYSTFEKCKDIFREKGLIQIFSEGKCINEWHLRPLKKGTARLAVSSWEDGIDLKVLPVGINYSSFRRFGKNVFVNTGDFITKEDIEITETDGKRYQLFNALLEEQLKRLVFEIPKCDRTKQKKLLEKKPSALMKWILFLPALFGCLLNAPIYLPAKYIAVKKAAYNDHYDSVLMVILLFTYPLYVLLMTVVLYSITLHWSAMVLFLVLPLTAWCYVQVKPQLDK